MARAFDLAGITNTVKMVHANFVKKAGLSYSHVDESRDGSQCRVARNSDQHDSSLTA